jgi:hypothetical protein
VHGVPASGRRVCAHRVVATQGSFCYAARRRPVGTRCRGEWNRPRRATFDAAVGPPSSRVTTIFKGNKFGERQSTSADAKRAILAKFQSRPPADDPEVQARAAERKAIADAREARLVERRIEREAEAARQAAEREAALLAEAARRKEEEAAAVEATRAEALLKLEQKAARDARYAARKARR